MQSELVDILVATYNPNINFLKKQLESLLCQNHTEIKIIISDDASTKREVKKVLEEYKQKDNRIEVYFNEQNVGYIKNFESLLKRSTANYIMFCDQDDIWFENKVKKSLQTLIEKDVSLVYTDARQINEEQKVINESYFKYKNMPVIEGKNNILTFSRHIAIGCSAVFTKEVKEKMLPFSEKVMAHDWLNVYIASNLKGIYCLNEPLLDYRLHTNNVFGGRGLKQNINIWKEEEGNLYKAYMKYRNESIKKAYLNGSKMCYEYIQNDEGKKVLDYYEKILKSKIINFNFVSYFKYLYFKKIGIRGIKEFIFLHFPVLGYLMYVIM